MGRSVENFLIDNFCRKAKYTMGSAIIGREVPGTLVNVILL